MGDKAFLEFQQGKNPHAYQHIYIYMYIYRGSQVSNCSKLQDDTAMKKIISALKVNTLLCYLQLLEVKSNTCLMDSPHEILIHILII